MEPDRLELMLQEAVQNLYETERRVEKHVARIKELEAAGRLTELRLARQTLAVISKTRDALQLRLQVAREVAATETRFLSGRTA